MTATETHRATRPLMAAATSCWWDAAAQIAVQRSPRDDHGGPRDVAAAADSWWCHGVRKCLLSAGAAICLAALAAVMVVTVWRYVQSPTCLACDDPPPIAAPPTLNLVAVAVAVAGATGTATPVSWKGQS